MGKGVPEMENQYRYHGAPLKEDAYAEAMAMDEAELTARKAALMERVRALDVRGWARRFLEALDAAPEG